MTQEIKQKLEQAADEYAIAWYNGTKVMDHIKRHSFKRGAQTILKNPGKWALVTADQYYTKRNQYEKHLRELCDKEVLLESRLTKYREALERIAAIAVDYQPSIQTEAALTIAKEALKQQ